MVVKFSVLGLDSGPSFRVKSPTAVTSMGGPNSVQNEVFYAHLYAAKLLI